MSAPTLVTGGAGYVGVLVVDELLDAGRDVRVLDVAPPRPGGRRRGGSSGRGVEVIRGDIRDADARRRALDGVERGRAPRRDRRRPGVRARPRGSRRRSTWRRRRALVADARDAGVRAASCSRRPARTTGAWTTRRCRSPRTASSRRSRSTPSRRSAIEKRAARGRLPAARRRTCLRFATVYGVAPRMRFDLTVNEFTRDLWADRELEVFGEQFWRPYVHVRDAAPRGAHGARGAAGAGRRRGVQRRALGRELPQARPRRDDPAPARPRAGLVRAPRRGPARLQGVASTRSAPSLGFETTMTVPDGIDEVDRGARRGALRRPVRRALEEHPVTSPTVPRIPLFDLKMEQADLDAVAETLRKGELLAGERGRGVRARVRRRSSACATASRSRAAPPRCTWPTSPRASGPATRSSCPSYTFVATAAAAIYCGATPVFADIVGEHDLGIDPDQVAAPSPRARRRCASCTTAATRPPSRSSPGCATTAGSRSSRTPRMRRWRSRATGRQARHLRHGLLLLLLQQGPVRRRGRAARDRRRRGRGHRAASAGADRRLRPPPRRAARRAAALAHAAACRSTSSRVAG